MIKLIKTGESCYFRNNKTDECYVKFDPNVDDYSLNINMENFNLIVDKDQIKVNETGQITVDYEGTRYNIDDGFQSSLTRCGYFVLDNYDTERIENREVGKRVRNRLIKNISDKAINVIKYYYDCFEDINIKTSNQKTKIKFRYPELSFEVTVIISSVNNIVAENKYRKDRGLTFIPFIKDMDKFGTAYLSIFIKNTNKDEVTSDKTRYNFAEELCKFITSYTIEKLREQNSYKSIAFRRIILKNKINELIQER